MQDFPVRRRVIPKMDITTKIIYSLCISLLCFAITKGDPKRSSLLNQIQITDKKLEYIFETTIAVETKTIKHTITERNEGIWKFIATYIKQPRWVNIQVNLKTRIGIRLNSIHYDQISNNMHIDFGSPQILHRSFQTKILSSSDNFFSSWSIASFQQHKDEFLKQLLDSQSQNIIDIFKSDSTKIRQLQRQYYRKVMTALNHNYSEYAPEILVFKLNQYIVRLMAKVIPPNMLQSINNSYVYFKSIENSNSTALKSEINRSAGNPSKNVKKQRRIEPLKTQGGSKRQMSIRQKMKRQLQL